MRQYLIEMQGTRSGPFSAEELAHMRANGCLPDDTKVIYPHESWDAATTLNASQLLLLEMEQFKSPDEITNAKILKAYVVILFGVLTVVWAFICPRYTMIESRYLVPSDSTGYYRVLDIGKFIAGELFVASIIMGMYMLYVEKIINKRIERWNLVERELNPPVANHSRDVIPPIGQGTSYVDRKP